MNIQPCEHICNECGFLKDGANKDTLFAETFLMANTGQVFPCHMYLKSKTGSENTGTETLETVKVCRGYIAYIKKNYPTIMEMWRADIQYIWFNQLLPYITDEDMAKVYTGDFSVLAQHHKGIQECIFLNNPIGEN